MSERGFRFWVTLHIGLLWMVTILGLFGEHSQMKVQGSNVKIMNGLLKKIQLQEDMIDVLHHRTEVQQIEIRALLDKANINNIIVQPEEELPLPPHLQAI